MPIWAEVCKLDLGGPACTIKCQRNLASLLAKACWVLMSLLLSLTTNVHVQVYIWSLKICTKSCGCPQVHYTHLCVVCMYTGGRCARTRASAGACFSLLNAVRSPWQIAAEWHPCLRRSPLPAYGSTIHNMCATWSLPAYGSDPHNVFALKAPATMTHCVLDVSVPRCTSKGASALWLGWPRSTSSVEILVISRLRPCTWHQKQSEHHYVFPGM